MGRLKAHEPADPRLSVTISYFKYYQLLQLLPVTISHYQLLSVTINYDQLA